MLGNFTTTTIITKGLFGGSARKGLITAVASLYCETPPAPSVPPPIVKTSGGGPYPGKAWNVIDNIRTFYKPVQFLVPAEERIPKTIITFKMNFNEHTIEKIYNVPETRKRIVIKIFAMLGATQKQYSIVMGKFKRITSRAKIKILSLKTKQSK